MEASPLTQQTRPDTFKPKIVQLYESLFSEADDGVDMSEGFWREFFLLKPDAASLTQILSVEPDELLNLQNRTQQLFLHAVECVTISTSPSDCVALDTLTVFLSAVLNKRYTNPSSDIISILAGLHDVDIVFTDFVATLDHVIRNGRDMEVRQKAVRTALALISGAYQTSLVSYLTHRDLFPALMKIVHDSDRGSEVTGPFILLALLTNYNKFEFQNPYRLRLDDFVNDSIIKSIVKLFGAICCSSRDQYITVQDDIHEGWNVGSTLNYFSLGLIPSRSRSTTPVLGPEEAKTRFAALPDPEAAALLLGYDFANANKLFCFNLVTLQAASQEDTSAMSGFLSLTSYFFQHAHRSSRASLYTYANVFIIQMLVEDQALAKYMCSEENKVVVRLCRQRQPYLPEVRGERPLAAIVMDIMVDGINHNLRRRLDIEFFLLCFGVLLRIISFLGRSRVRLSYHWAELWRSLLSFIRFLTTYADDLKSLRNIEQLIDTVVNLIALSLTTGESFLPDTSSYDDLFYKLVETGSNLEKFRDTYSLQKRPSCAAINILTEVSSHYHDLLNSDERKGKSKNLSSREVVQMIKQGYETLSIEQQEGLDAWERFREADHKVVLKKMARLVVDDARRIVEQPQ